MFTRLCIDLDRAGNLCGASYEIHGDDGVQSFGTALVAPFETPVEAFVDLLEAHRHQIGAQLPIF